MAIEPSLLQIRHGDVTIAQNHLSATWEVYHAATATVLESGRVQVPMAGPQRIAEAWEQLVAQIFSATRPVLSKHQGMAAIGGHSVWDADLILDSWLSDTEAHTLAHPISGTFTGITYTGIVGLVNAILAKVLPPPVWFWAEPVAGGVRVKCIAVPTAAVYYVYNGTTLLGNVPSAGWNTLTLPDGAYSVRMAGVKAGVVGVCSFPVAVQVGVVTPPGLAAGVVSAPKPKGRIARFFSDPFGVQGDDA